MNDARDGVAKLDLSITYGVAPDDDCASFVKPLRAAVEDYAQQIQIELIVWKAHEVQPGLRLAAHRVNIAEGVRRRNLTVGKGIIDHRRKEIDSLHQR